LYYRLNVITIHVPPLRERGSDIELLARQFMRQFVRKLGSPVRGMHKDFVDFLNRHPWPGNVRELQNVIERAVILADSEVLTIADLEEAISRAAPGAATTQGGDLPLSIEDYIREVITLYQDSHSETELAAILGIGRKALWMRRRSWGLYRHGDRGNPGAEALLSIGDEGLHRVP
jgi:DNA-binding NtrC family response regulator